MARAVARPQCHLPMPCPKACPPAAEGSYVVETHAANLTATYKLHVMRQGAVLLEALGDAAKGCRLCIAAGTDRAFYSVDDLVTLHKRQNRHAPNGGFITHIVWRGHVAHPSPVFYVRPLTEAAVITPPPSVAAATVPPVGCVTFSAIKASTRHGRRGGRCPHVVACLSRSYQRGGAGGPSTGNGGGRS